MRVHEKSLLSATLAIFLAAVSFAATADVIEYDCTFALRASKEGLDPNDDFKFSLTLDSLTGEAFLKGNLGLSKVFTHRDGETVTFVEPLATGAINTTTVIESGEAVHSRHVVFGGFDLFPSQYYGKCAR